MDAAAIQRFARQIALPEVGPDGQARLAAACVVVAGGGLGAEVAARYLTAAGVGTVRLLGVAGAGAGEDIAWPGADGEAWLAALAGASCVVRVGFEDDPMLPAAQRLGIPAVITRAPEASGAVDLLSFANHPAAPETPLAVATSPRQPAPDGPSAVVAGTLAAAEALHALLRRASGGGGPRHLRLPLDGGPIVTQQLPGKVA